MHSSFEKSLIERVKQYFKDRIESFDDYYPCIQKEARWMQKYIINVHNWIQFFVSMYNDTITTRNNEFEIKLKEVNIS